MVGGIGGFEDVGWWFFEDDGRGYLRFVYAVTMAVASVQRRCRNPATCVSGWGRCPCCAALIIESHRAFLMMEVGLERCQSISVFLSEDIL